MTPALGTCAGFCHRRRMVLAGNIVIALVLLAAFLGGLALFWIARQDDSRAGRLLGLLGIAIAAVATLYLSLGKHWF